MSKDPFELLGVDREASWEEVRRAYLRKVRELHPDRGGNVEAYLELQQVYESLRSAYEARRRVQVIRERPRGGDYFLAFIELTVKEVALGTEKWIRVPGETRVCKECKGTGLDIRGRRQVCDWCGGRGLMAERESPLYQHPCPRCRGGGILFLDPCPRCRGKGEVRGEKEIRISIPAGVKEGDLLFVPRSPDGPAMDVFLEVQIRKDETFFLEGENLVSRVKVPFWKAALGGRVRVQTLEGEEEIELPPGLPAGSRLMWNHRGPFRSDGRRGHLILEFEVWFPREYPPEARRVLEKFYEIMEGEYGGTACIKQ